MIDWKIVKFFFKSLPERFQQKVIVVEVNKDADKLKLVNL